MNALGMIAYLLGCVIVATLLTFVIAAVRPVKRNDDFKVGRYIIVLALILAVAPYGYAEFMTRQHGAGMEEAIKRTIKSAKITGKLKYFRVMSANEGAARVIVVAKEKTTLTDNEAAVMEVKLEKNEDNEWKAKTYKFIDSFKRGKDSVTFPPFW